MRARHKEEGKEYAIKIIHKKKTKNEIDRIAAEMEILQSVDHPNVIHLKELFELDNKLYIVTDLARGGELFDRIVQKKSYTEREASLLIRNLLNALIYLHKKGIVLIFILFYFISYLLENVFFLRFYLLIYLINYLNFILLIFNHFV